MSQKKVVRLVGESAAYDVFISYRVNSDAHHAEMLYNLLTGSGLKVWWDKICLEPGVEWKEGFCAGLVNSRAFVCLVSRDAINHPECAWQNFSKLTAESACDNVLLEHRLALELKDLGLIEYVFPVMIGRAVNEGTVYDNFFQGGGSPKAPDVSVASVEAELRKHMNSQGLGSPLTETKTVASIISSILSYQGALVQGERDASLSAAAASVLKMFSKVGESASGLAAGTIYPNSLVSATDAGTSQPDDLNIIINQLRIENTISKQQLDMQIVQH